ncbi:MAG: RagB/SusD family nutrient uptake outer membrane protein [Bacteroidota bacterium]
MRKYINYLGAGFLLTLITFNFSSCDKDFEEYNQDPFAVTNIDLERDNRLLGEPFINIIQNIYVHTPAWITQLQQNLIGDVYSGYMMPPTPFAGNSNNMNYNLVDGWNTWAWNPAYQNVMAPGLDVVINADGKSPEFLGWLDVIQVTAMHRVADMFGPIIYTNFGKVEADGTIQYDCVQDAYNAFFDDLDRGINALTDYANTNPGVEPFAKFDEVYAGDMTKWIQYANSLRLRLAIRISKVDPVKAKQEAEAAFNHPMGLMLDNGSNFTIKNSIDHPMNTINNAWNDIRMGAPMESILTGYNDPRMDAYFRPSDIVPGVHKGIRQGIPIADKGDYVTFSALQDLGDVQIMVCSEVYFLRAEGALRGWNMGGTAKELYEEGIRKSFEQYGLGGADAYLADNAGTAIDYIDAFNADNNIAALSNVTIAWDEGADFETSLERIITQKWIAMFPDGQEAWSEYRRTSYPPLFPVVLNNSNGEIDTDEQIKRIKYPSSEYAQNPNGVAGAVQCLGGADTGGTSLWWDID